MNILRFFVAGFACYRISHLFVYDEGPWAIFAKLRSFAGMFDYDASGAPKTLLGRLLSCPFCVGLWTALPLVFWLISSEGWYDLLIYWFAIAGFQSLLEFAGERA